MDVDGERFDDALEASEGTRAARSQDTDLDAPRTSASSSTTFKAIVREDTGRDFPTDPYEQLDLAIKAVFAQLVRQARPRLPQEPEDRRRPRHRRQRRDDGLRQHGRRLGHRRRLHPRPEHRREGPLRRVPHERPGRGRRRRHPDAPKIAQMATDMPAVYDEFQRIGKQLERHYRDVQDLEFTIERGRLYMLQTRIGEADRRGGREDRGRHGRRGHDHARRRRVARIEPAQVDQLLRATFDPNALKGATKIVNGPQRVARRGGRAGGLRRRRRRRVGRAAARRSSSSGSRRRPTTSTAWPSPRASSPPAAARPRTPRSSPARSASRASPARADLVVDYGAQDRPHCNVTGTELQGGRLGQPRRLDRRRCTSARCRRSRRGSRTSPSSRRSSAGPTRSAGWASGRTPTSPRRPPRPGATAPRASASAGPSTCSARASGSRSSAARSSSPSGRRGPRRRPPPARRSTPTSRTAVATFDAAMAKLEVLQQGDFEGIFRAMDGLPVVIRLIDPPLHEFLPNLEEQLVKVTESAEEHGGADATEDKRAPRDDRVAARAEPDARAARLPPGADDPGLREDPDPGDPQRRDRGQAVRRPPDRQDHDPARRPRERARRDAGASSRPRRQAVEARRPAASRSTTSSGR